MKEEDSGEDETENKIPNLLSKRIVLSQLNGIYDPLGLLVPFTIKGKLLMPNLWAKNVDWDTPLSGEERSKWISFFEMLEVPSVYFPRSIKSSNASSKQPILVTFSDASKEAFGCCSYIRWQLNNGLFHARLIASKSRVAPLKTTTIVRLELSAAVLAKRIRSFIEDSFRIKFEKVVHIIDSQIVKAMINKESYGFNTFVATRVGEIQAKTDPDEWYWVESKLNAADIITRGTNIRQLDSESTWQNGPEFLTQPINEWPIHDDSMQIEELPEISGYACTSLGTPRGKPLIEIHRFSSYMRLIRVTARILCLLTANPKHSLFSMNTILEPRHLDNAKSFWEKLSQADIQEELRKAQSGKWSLRKLNVKEIKACTSQ